ncbi:MAG: hypothetical protein GFH27_549375n19 [Chloroflexi bacterium AL-W]|nr:hypothetical protein [Chloroflexi bacterium AL-W]
MRINKKLVLMLTVLVMLFAVSPALAAEEAGPLEALGINVGFLIAQVVNFGLIFFFLMFFLWGPMTNRLDERSRKIEQGLEDAAKAAEARRNAETEAEKILAQARTESNQVVEEARGRGEELAKGIQAEARREADKIREDARIAAQGEINAELAGMRAQVSTIAIAVAQRLLGETLDEKKQQALVNNFFSKVPADVKSLSGSVEVVSAMPLSDAEQAKVKQEIGADDVTFSVNPSILGGLIVRAGDRVIDGSVRRDLNEMAERIS